MIIIRLSLYLLVFLSVSISAFPYSGRILNNLNRGIKDVILTVVGAEDVCTTNTNGEFGDYISMIVDKNTGMLSCNPVYMGNKIYYYADKAGTPVVYSRYSLQGKLVVEYRVKSLKNGLNSIVTDFVETMGNGVCLARLHVGNRVFVNKSIRMAKKTASHFYSIGATNDHSNILASSMQKSRMPDSLFIHVDGYNDTTIYVSSKDVGDIVLSEQYKPAGMVLIPAKDSSFSMGNDENYPDEYPVHTVTFTHNFFMDTTEVTQKVYSSVMSKLPGYSRPYWNSIFGMGNEYPVYQINFFDAALYCNTKSKRDKLDTVYTYGTITGIPGNNCELSDFAIDYTKIGYRMATEAEWEYSYRAGVSHIFYWASSAYGDINKNAWYSANSGRKCHPVAGLEPNAFGLYDMAGNVHERCNDFYGDYTDASVIDPIGPDKNAKDERVIRGGCWFWAPDDMRASRRKPYKTNIKLIYGGFRTVLLVK